MLYKEIIPIDEIEKLIFDIEHTEIEDLISLIDCKIFACSLKLVYEHALKRYQLIHIIGLEIADILDDNHRIGDQVRIPYKKKGELLYRSISFRSNSKKLMYDHLTYLDSAGYSTDLTSALFPKNKKGEYYTRKTFDRQLKKCVGYYYRKTITLEDIRQASIRNYYDSLANLDFGMKKYRLQLAADFAGCDLKQTRNIVTGEIPLKTISDEYVFYADTDFREDPITYLEKNLSLPFFHLLEVSYCPRMVPLGDDITLLTRFLVLFFKAVDRRKDYPDEKNERILKIELLKSYVNSGLRFNSNNGELMEEPDDEDYVYEEYDYDELLDVIERNF